MLAEFPVERPWVQLLRSSILRDALGIGLIKLLQLPIGLALAIILARGLGPADYGRYAFTISLVGLIGLPLGGGLAQLLTREVALARQSGEHGAIRGIIRGAVVWSLASSAVVLAAWELLLASGQAPVEDALRPVLTIGLLALPMMTLAPVWAGTLRGLGLVALSQFPGLLVAPLLQLMIVLALGLAGKLDVRTAICALVAANLLVAALGIGLMRRHQTQESRSARPAYHLREWAPSWLGFTLIGMLIYMTAQAGVLLLGFFATASAVGAFQIADRGAVFVALPLLVLELALAPHLAQRHREGDRAELQRLFTIPRRAGAGAAVVIAIPLVFYGSPIVRLVFGAEYVPDAVAPLAILSGAMVLRGFLGPAATLLMMSGNERVALWAQAVALVVTAVTCALLAPGMGATGAAWAVAAGTVVLCALIAWQTHRRLGIRLLEL